MPAPISTVPQGLLGLLNLKSQGETPSQLVPSVQPAIDMRQFYLAQDRRSTRWDGTGGAAISDSVIQAGGLVVPAGELWFVWNVSAQMTIVNGSSVSGVAAIDVATTTFPYFGFLAQVPCTLTAPAANSAVVNVGGDVMRVVPERATISFWMSRLVRTAAVQYSVAICCEYTPLKL